MNKSSFPQLPGVNINPIDLIRTYSQKDFAEATGYCERMLSEMKANGHPAFKNGKWHVYPWLLWSAGLLPEKKKAGRPRL